MEAKLLLNSENGIFEMGPKVASTTFRLPTALPLNGGHDFHCALRYIEFQQFNINLDGVFTMQLGKPIDPRAKASPIIWEQSVKSMTIQRNNLTDLLVEISDFATKVPGFDGFLDIGIEEKDDGTPAPYANMITKSKAVRLSENLARLLGFAETEFGPHNKKPGIPATVSPSLTRWRDEPIMLCLDIISEQGMALSGADTIVPQRDEAMQSRIGYLKLLPLKRDDPMELEKAYIQMDCSDNLQWSRVQKSMIHEITVSFRWSDGSLVQVDPLLFKFCCEIMIKRRLNLSFA